MKNSSPKSIGQLSVVRACATLLLMSPVLAGCGSRTAAQAGKESPPAIAADDVLKEMIAAYQHASSYSDQGKVQVSFRQDGKRIEDQADLSVKLVRPNKLSLKAYQVLIACDGKTYHAKIADEATADMDNQVVVRAAPETLSLQELYSDAVLHDVINSGLGRYPVQLELLLSETPLESVFQPTVQRALLEDGRVEDRPCYRVSATSAEGMFVFWIDRQNHLLQRLEYPTDALLGLQPQSEQVSDLQLVANFYEAKFGDNPPGAAFQFMPSPDAKQVRFFVVPPQPLPSDRFGKQLGDFFFTNLQAGKVTRDSLAGKIAVLVWFNNHQSGKATLEQLEKVRTAYQDNDRVSFHAVCTEPSSMSNDQLAQLIDSWGVSVPVVRDLEPFGNVLFHISALPTLVVLDGQSVLQIFDVGLHPKLSEELPIVLERLLKGDNIAADILRDFQNDMALYQRSLIAAGAAQTAALVELPETKIVARSEPKQLKLTKLWTCSELSAPGNILTFQRSPKEPASAEASILVFDGWQTVAEVDAKGQVAQRHLLELPDSASVSYLRTAVDASGRRYFVACAAQSQQLYLFDQDWKLLLSYPDVHQEHPGIIDTQISDLDNDGTPELYVGFWDLIGVQGVSLEGKRLWSNRTNNTVLSLATTPPDDIGWRKLLVTGDRGAISRINQFGSHDPQIAVRERAIHRLFADSVEDNLSATYCGISYTPDGNLVAVGLSGQFEEQWSYALPPGAFRNQIQFVTSGRLLQRPGGQWVLAGPDGSIHIVAADGNFNDHFHYGERLTGLATAQLGSSPVLLVATEKNVTAWNIDFHTGSEQ
jgi:hypothetical protein